MAKEDSKILKYDYGAKSMKVPFIIYVDSGPLLEKISYHNNPKKSSKTEINKHTASRYSLFTNFLFDTTKSKLDYYTGKNCMKKNLSGFKITCNINNWLWKIDTIPLTNEEIKLHREQKLCYICKKEFSANDEKYQVVRDHCCYIGKYRGDAHDFSNLRHKIPKEIYVVFHYGSTYNYHFRIKDLAKKFKGQSELLEKNT